MEFEINKEILLKSISRANGIIEKKTTLPILSNILLEAKNSPNVQFGVNNVVQAISYHSILDLVNFCDNHKMLINNILMCDNFIKSLTKKNINHLLYISSDAVYKDTKNKINEQSCAMPNSLHGIMHLLRENMILVRFS